MVEKIAPEQTGGPEFVNRMAGSVAPPNPNWLETVKGYGPIRQYSDDDRELRVTSREKQSARLITPKVLASIEAAFDACEIRDGATLSFHHHLRNGDAAVNAVLAVAAARGLQGLRIAASSIFPIHAPLVPLMRSGVIRSIWTDYANGPVADEIASGTLEELAVFQTHGGRARAIESGQLDIDVAFIAAPAADQFGGVSATMGPSACGPLGYPRVDADYAHRTVVLTDSLLDEPLSQTDISSDRIDHVVEIETIGNPNGIVSGSTRTAEDRAGLGISDLAARAIAASGVMTDGFSFQTGAGGVSLATAKSIGEEMQRTGIQGDFICGGIMGSHVDMVERGLFKRLLNVQSFDLAAVRSYAQHTWHQGISASEYASPLHPDPVAHRLSVMILGVAEIDRAFNINVTTSGDGRIVGGPGGHPDTAAGARLTIATTRLTGGGYPKVVDRVGCITTPGCDVDLLVTEAGIAVNSRQPALKDRLSKAGLPIVDIASLIAGARAQSLDHSTFPSDEFAALIEYRDGSVIDFVSRT